MSRSHLKSAVESNAPEPELTLPSAFFQLKCTDPKHAVAMSSKEREVARGFLVGTSFSLSVRRAQSQKLRIGWRGPSAFIDSSEQIDRATAARDSDIWPFALES
jgi:hypothetical protein